MHELVVKFKGLPADDTKKAHIRACAYSVSAWDKFCADGKNLSYKDSVVFLTHKVDKSLLSSALQAVIDNHSGNLLDSFLEPINALEEMDWTPGQNIEYAFYSIYNLYKKYCLKEDIDDWLIVNQVLSTEPDERKMDEMLKFIVQ